jgi:hypothetical protein
MNCSDNLERVVSSVQNPHMNCFVTGYCPAVAGEVVACCRIARYGVGYVFGLILEGGG